MAETNDDEQIGQGEPWEPWKRRISAARKRRDDRVDEWRTNVDLRKGAANRTGETYKALVARPVGRGSVNKDAPLTKAKIANLYSQTPEPRLSIRRGFEAFAPALPAFQQELIDIIGDASVGSTIEENLADVVNAAGIGGVIVSCEKRTEKRQVPTIDPATLPPEMQQAAMMGALEIPMTEVDHPVDVQYLVTRISPAEMLIPSDFTGSNYDHARWLGRDGRLTWAQAQIEFGLTDEQKDLVLGADKRAGGKVHTLNSDYDKFRDSEVVHFTELFHWRHFYDAEEKNFKALQRLVFVDGLDEPPINEPYKAQIRTEDGKIAGVVKNPIRVCTLTYISDEALPPSDSSISRDDVNDLEESRADMRLQRKHSIPIRWGDTNRISKNAREKINEGDYQGFVWTNGPGDRAIGEVARAAFPPEKFEFDRIIDRELSEKWQVGVNQAGNFSSGERSAREAGIIDQNFQRRQGQEQDKVQKYFIGIVEVLAGHLALYGTFDMPDELGPMRQQMANAVTYSVRVDSTVRLDAKEQIDRLEHVIDRSVQSPYINSKPLYEKWMELHGIDPATVVIDPQPKPPEPVKVSIGSAEDIINPLMLATLSRTGQLPSPDDVAAVAKLLAAVGLIPGIAPLMAPPTQPSNGQDGPPREGDTPGIANPDAQMAPRQDKRDEDGGA